MFFLFGSLTKAQNLKKNVPKPSKIPSLLSAPWARWWQGPGGWETIVSSSRTGSDAFFVVVFNVGCSFLNIGAFLNMIAIWGNKEHVFFLFGSLTKAQNIKKTSPNPQKSPHSYRLMPGVTYTDEQHPFNLLLKAYCKLLYTD